MLPRMSYRRRVQAIADYEVPKGDDISVAEFFLSLKRLEFDSYNLISDPDIFQDTIDVGIPRERVVEFAKGICDMIAGYNVVNRFPSDWDAFKAAIEEL
jgi:hypothetical protein